MKAIVLVSGGLDSAVCLAEAIDKFGKNEVMALSMFYGQKHEKELLCAEALCKHYDVRHMIRDLSQVFSMSNCSLLGHSTENVAHGSYKEQQEAEGIQEGAVATYVPFRNGLFLSYATAIAYSVGAQWIYYGAHSDDAAGNAYPDTSDAFREGMAEAIARGTGKKVMLKTPFILDHKADIVERGLELNVPFELTWSCYEGGEFACGECGTCIDRKAAFDENNAIDPILYKQLVEDALDSAE